MPVPTVFVVCTCPEHGEVVAKRTGEYEGGSPDPRYSYQCPGVEGDTGGCFAGMLTPLGRMGDRPPWAEYPDEHLGRENDAERALGGDKLLCMRVLNGEVPPALITEDSQLAGQMQGDGRVASGAHLELLGQVCGDLTIDAGASAVILGQVTGDLINNGNVKVAGMIVGRLIDAAGTAQVEPGATITPG